MTNMANTPPILPPEIVRIVVSYLNRDVALTLGMTNRYCAGLFSGIYYNSWEVCCCTKAQTALVIISGPNNKYNRTTIPETAISESHGIYYSTKIQDATIYESNWISMDWFFRALKSELAPVYAKRVHFTFCTHPQPVKHDDESCSKTSLQTNWPLDQTREFLKLLDASEIVVTIRDPHKLGHICNEPFLRALLSESLCALPNTIVKLRVDNRGAPGLDPGSLYFTIRDSSTSQAAVADNLQRALSQIRPSSIDYDLWDGHERYKFCPARQIVGIYPNVRYLRLSRYYVIQDDILLQKRRDYVEQPDKYLAAVPRCQSLICRWELVGHHGHLETTFCFDNVSAQKRKCTKILVHNELFGWVHDLSLHSVVLKHVKVLEFHHTQHDTLARRWSLPYTPPILNVLLACLLWSFPNLEKMIVKFGAGKIMAGPNHLGSLSKGFCEDCELSVNVLELDIRTLVREGLLSAANPRSAINVLLKVTFKRLRKHRSQIPDQSLVDCSEHAED